MLPMIVTPWLFYHFKTSFEKVVLEHDVSSAGSSSHTDLNTNPGLELVLDPVQIQTTSRLAEGKIEEIKNPITMTL